MNSTVRFSTIATVTLRILGPVAAATAFDASITSDNVNEPFIFKICSTVLETTEWKFMSTVIFDTKEVELSNKFLKNFHNEVTTVAIYVQ